jgi:hypothetical protein
MPTNFTVFAHALSFEFVRDQRSPQGFELVVSRSDRRERNAYSQQGIRGHWLQKDDGSDEWLSQPFTK